MLMDPNGHKQELRGQEASKAAPLNCTQMRVEPPPTHSLYHTVARPLKKRGGGKLLSGTTAGSVRWSPPGSCCLSYMGLQTACYKKRSGVGVPDHWGLSAENSVSTGTRHTPNRRWQKALALMPQLPALRGEPHQASAMSSSSLQHRRIHGVLPCDGAVRAVQE